MGLECKGVFAKGAELDSCLFVSLTTFPQEALVSAVTHCMTGENN